MNPARTTKLVIRIAALAAITVCYGLQAQDQPQESTTESSSQTAQLTLNDLRTFSDVFNQVRKNYVDEIDDKTLLDSAIRGMLMELDPHSSYLEPEQLENLEDVSHGRYSGIGVNVDVEDYRIVVKSILVDSPADEAGLNPGDVITSIDGEAVEGRYLPEAVDELDGDPGTEVTVRFVTGEGEEKEALLQREYLQIPTLSYIPLEHEYGYFKLTQFHRDSASDLEQTLESIRSSGVELQGVVLDLRDNPGGVLQPAIAIADGFLDEGLIATTRGRNESMQLEFQAQPGQWLPSVPVILLVDRGTASASEVLAGALQDNRRALVVGEQTFGKGSVQSVIPLRNGGGIKLTTARYYTPSGRSIQAAGIRPDIVIDEGSYADASDHRVRESELDRHLDGEIIVRASPDELSAGPLDFPMDEALEVLDQAGLLSGADTPRPAEPAASNE
jgi:carboxyl-terminal processing protease